MAALCRQFRLSPVENIALGETKDSGSTIKLYYGALMTVPKDSVQSTLKDGDALQHAKEGASWNSENVYEFNSTVCTLSQLMDKYKLSRVDVLSLDVEGYELKILNGIDFAKHSIKFILVETSQIFEVERMLSATHRLVEKLSFHDYLFDEI